MKINLLNAASAVFYTIPVRTQCKRFLKQLFFVLLIFCSVGVWGQMTYRLITSTTELVAGSKYMIASSKTISTQLLGYQNSNNRPQSNSGPFPISSGSITVLSAAIPNELSKPYELTLGGNAGAWTLTDSATGINLQATSSSENILKKGSGTWTIYFNSDAAVITCNNGGDRNIIRYNSNLFSCYSTGQKEIYLFKEVSSTPTSYSAVSTGAGLEPTTISSLTTILTGAVSPQQNAIVNFDFNVTDDANSTAENDNLPTLINKIVLAKGSGNTTGDWTQVIAGAELSDGTNTIGGTVNIDKITFSSIPINVNTLGYVADGQSKTYTLKVWLKTFLGGTLRTTIDGSVVAFKIDRTGFSTENSATSTQFESGSGTAVESGATNNKIAVVATQLNYVQNAKDTGVNVSMSPAVTISANDVNGNRDLNYTELIGITSTGSLAGTPFSAASTSGIATFSSIKHTAPGSSLYLKANSGSFTEITSNAFAINLVTSASDYFRSKTTGNWNAVASWESSADNSFWIPSSFVPNSVANTITIEGGHTITINASVLVDQIVIKNGGYLEVDKVFTVNNGIGDDIIIQNGGTLNFSSTNRPSFNTSSTISVESYGRILVSNGSAITFAANNYLFKNASVLEWLQTGSFSSSDVTYFSNVDENTIPIFRISEVITGIVGGGKSTVINGILEVNGGVTFGVGGDKTFRNGIRGSGTVIQNSTSGMLIVGSATVAPEIGGSVTLNVLSAGLQLPNGAHIPVGADVKIISSAENSSINRQGGNVTVDGTLDITNMRITNTAAGSVAVSGILKTAHTGGLRGEGSAIVEGIVTLNPNSTIEYSATVDQIISSSPNYYHLIFSGAGIKTTQGVINVDQNGSVKITGTTTVDATSNLASTGNNNIAFIMDGGRLRLNTGGTKPNMQGDYNLTGGVVEFASNSTTNIRTGAPAKQYFNVEVSGNKVETGGKNFIINNLLKVNSTGVLKIPEVADTENSFVVTAKKGIQVADGGTALFKNNAQLLQDADAINVGNIIMLRNSKMKRLDYIYWGAPVSGQAFQPFSPNTVPSRFYNYNEIDDSFSSIQNPAISTFTAAKGYAIRAPNNASASNYDPFEGTFRGTPNNGNNFIFNLQYTGPAHGLNMIANPFPCNIDLRVLANNNSALTDGLYYFWTNNANSGTGNPTTTPNGSYGTYALNQYATLNALGATPATSGAEGAGVFPSSIVRPGQGFLIKAKAAGTLTFNHSIRTSAITDGTHTSIFFNNKQKNNDRVLPADRIWLQLITPANNKNILLVGYVEDGSNAFDSKYDAEAMNASDQFYSIVEGKHLAIQGRSYPLLDEDVVPLGASFYEPGTYSIGIERKEGIFESGKPVFLHDKKLSSYTNLQNQNYIFTAENGVDNGRFDLVYEEIYLGANSSEKEGVIVYRKGENFVVKASTPITDLEVYDSVGRKVLLMKANKKEVVIAGAQMVRGVYILKIKTKNEISSQKIIR